jgi:hypothetical protein
MSIPATVYSALSNDRYRRHDPSVVHDALSRLGVCAGHSFVEFYQTFRGPFWGMRLGIELADLVDDRDNVESLTRECRNQFAFPRKYLVLTALSPGGTIHVLDADTDHVYVVDFEGGDGLLKSGQLEPEWKSFQEFLCAYF